MVCTQRIIDEKGKLFGKVNVIDFLIILFLVCLVPVSYFGYKILTKRPEVLSQISVGDKELGWDGEVIGEIVSLGQSEPYKYEFDIGGGEKIVKETADLRQLKARLKLKAAVQKASLYYKNKIIKIGLPLEFKVDNYILIAVPFSEEEEEKEKEMMIDLYVTLKDLDEDIIKEISVGDKEVNENGEVIAEILSLGKIENSSLELNLGGGNFVMGEDSRKRQIFTKMRLKCQVQLKDDNKIYFKGKKMENNTVLEFETNDYKAKGLIAKTFEITSPIEEKWISLQVKFSGVFPEIAAIVQKGDIEKDAFDKVIAKINSIISNASSEVLILKENEFITLSHPFNKDILISLNVLCIEKEGVLYFKNYPIKMGNSIFFSTDLYSISGVIIGLEIK